MLKEKKEFKSNNIIVKDLISEYEKAYSDYVECAKNDEIIEKIQNKLNTEFIKSAKVLNKHNLYIFDGSGYCITIYTDKKIKDMNLEYCYEQLKYKMYYKLYKIYNENSELFLEKSYRVKIGTKDKLSEVVINFFEKDKIKNLIFEINKNSTEVIRYYNKIKDHLNTLNKIEKNIKYYSIISNFSENMIYIYRGVKYKIYKINYKTNKIYSKPIDVIDVRFNPERLVFDFSEFWYVFNDKDLKFDDASKRIIILNELMNNI